MTAPVRATSPATPAAAPAPAPAVPSPARRVGFLGTGYIADWHAKALRTVGGATLVAVCDKLAPRAQAFAAKVGVGAVYDSLDKMLSAERLDVVHLLLPPDLHAAAAREILSAGVHVFTEKPMGATAEECDALVRLASDKGLSLGVGHNFLFSAPYEALRNDVRQGLLGPLDHVVLTWHKELPQVTVGPFDGWMFRDPANIMLEIGSHAVAHLLDLVGRPDSLRVRRGNPTVLPTGRPFYRRWQVDAEKGRTLAELRFSFVPGFTEQTIHVRGLFGTATADLERNTYTLRRHEALADDFDRHAVVENEALGLLRQAEGTLRNYLFSKFRRTIPGGPYAASIAGTLASFYAGLGRTLDERIAGSRGAEVVRVCEQIGREGAVVEPAPAAPPARASAEAPAANLLVLGSTGFIGQELLRQLIRAGRPTRILVRNPGKLSPELRSGPLESLRGDLAREADLRAAMQGIHTVIHVARASVKTWPEYERDEIGVTRMIGEAAIAAGVKRLVYAGTIDSYYAGGSAGTITEDTPLDPRIGRRNLYARAKAESERLLQQMHRERGLPLVICRPGIVIGKGGSPFHWGVGMWWHGSVCQVWGDGRNKLPLVLVEDVAKGLLLAGETPGIEGQSFNLVDDPCLTAHEYLDELDRAGGFRLRRKPASILDFYLTDLAKWFVKVLVRHPERRFPSYRDWESRTQRATFDCARAKTRLGWKPAADRDALIRRGIQEPLQDLLR
jgi:predicted dehydrogenase/nucleoside-diphosphate-sugar epimerase